MFVALGCVVKKLMFHLMRCIQAPFWHEGHSEAGKNRTACLTERMTPCRQQLSDHSGQLSSTLYVHSLVHQQILTHFTFLSETLCKEVGNAEIPPLRSLNVKSNLKEMGIQA